MSLGCARCGKCCDPVDLDPENVAKFDRALAQVQDGAQMPPVTSPTESLPFMLAHWTEISRTEDGAKYECDRYDKATRSCTAHEDRPDVCRDYPFYGRDPATGVDTGISPTCSYLLDVPVHLRPAEARPLIPITAVVR